MAATGRPRPSGKGPSCWRYGNPHIGPSLALAGDRQPALCASLGAGMSGNGPPGCAGRLRGGLDPHLGEPRAGAEGAAVGARAGLKGVEGGGRAGRTAGPARIGGEEGGGGPVGGGETRRRPSAPSRVLLSPPLRLSAVQLVATDPATGGSGVESGGWATAGLSPPSPRSLAHEGIRSCCPCQRCDGKPRHGNSPRHRVVTAATAHTATTYGPL